MDFFKDVEFWALIISVISLGFSVFPTARNWWKGVKLTIEAQDTVGLSHRFGYTNLNWALTLINSGGVSVRVKKISITLERDGLIQTLPARTFFKTFDTNIQSLFSSFLLKPGDEVTHTFAFHSKLTRSEDKEINDIMSSARQELPLSEQMGHSINKSPTPTLSGRTLKKLSALYISKFYLASGEYSLTLEAYDEHGRKLADRNCRFTLFESDESNLRQIAANYHTGDGVLFFSDNQNFWLQTTLTET